MNAQQILHKEYGYSKNFITPVVDETGIVYQNDFVSYAYEISHGSGIFSKYIVGVSIVKYDKINKKTERSDKSQSFSGDKLSDTIADAKQFIHELFEELKS